jgi:hypothetical protein
VGFDTLNVAQADVSIGLSRNHFGCIDIFEHFKSLAKTNSLPEFEELEDLARKLHRSYSSTRAHYRALNDPDLSSEWAQFVPTGSPWRSPIIDENSQVPTQPKKGKANQAEFKGDRTLANSIAFLRDGILSREMAYATAEGDPGRVYAVMKVSLQFKLSRSVPNIPNRSCYSRLQALHILNMSPTF